jgi:hypothetical protein
VIICNFSGCVNIFLDLNQEIMDFYKYLDRDFSSQLFLFTFRGSILASIWAKSVGHSNFFQKILTKIWIISKSHGYLNLSRWSRLVSTIWIKISMQPSLDWKVSTEKKKVDLDRRENLDTKDVLDLDWSRLSRPPGLILTSKNCQPMPTMLTDSYRKLDDVTYGYRCLPDVSWGIQCCQASKSSKN